MSATIWFLHAHGWNDHIYEDCPGLMRQAAKCEVWNCDHAIIQGADLLDPVLDYNPAWPKDICGWCRRVCMARQRRGLLR